MITQDTAVRIFNAHREIECARELIADMNDAARKYHPDKNEPSLKDAFGRVQHLQLGVPCGQTGHRLFNVRPQLAVSCIKAHIATMQTELTEANEQARIELDLDHVMQDTEAADEEGKR